MKRVTRNGLIAAAAASGALAMTMPAHADATADGATAASPGLISGNTLQLPVHVPVNVCGNTVNVAGLLNPAAGNSCANVSEGRGPGVGGRSHGRGGESAGGVAHGGAATRGGAVAVGSGKDSPGVLSGNGLQLPVHLPVNVSGNSVNVVGLGNASVGNTSTNTSGDHPQPVKPAPKPHTPPRAYVPQGTPYHAPSRPMASLAHTGADQTMPAIAASAALLLGGAVLYRRFRPTGVR
ncbi:chaplin [Streptomyces sp. NPDC007896]|uniref:chaplin n=1 Tax=Streptomyces sp. NPDC007896 TaxID=3364784 RepID=UPI0036EC32E0